MTQYGFFVDVSKCTGCKTCMVACKDGHFAQPGMNRFVNTAAEHGARQTKVLGSRMCLLTTSVFPATTVRTLPA